LGWGGRANKTVRFGVTECHGGLTHDHGSPKFCARGKGCDGTERARLVLNYTSLGWLGGGGGGGGGGWGVGRGGLGGVGWRNPLRRRPISPEDKNERQGRDRGEQGNEREPIVVCLPKPSHQYGEKERENADPHILGKSVRQISQKKNKGRGVRI